MRKLMKKRPREPPISTDADRFPFQFVTDKYDIYFALYDWSKFFKIEQQFKVEEITSKTFVEAYDDENAKHLNTMFKDYFEDERRYNSFLLARITLDKNIPFDKSLATTTSNGLLFFQNPVKSLKKTNYEEFWVTFYKHLLGDWSIYDLDLYRQLKVNLDLLGFNWRMKRGHQSKWGRDVLIMELSKKNKFAGLWFLSSLRKIIPDRTAFKKAVVQHR